MSQTTASTVVLLVVAVRSVFTPNREYGVFEWMPSVNLSINRKANPYTDKSLSKSYVGFVNWGMFLLSCFHDITEKN